MDGNSNIVGTWEILNNVQRPLLKVEDNAVPVYGTATVYLGLTKVGDDVFRIDSTFPASINSSNSTLFLYETAFYDSNFLISNNDTDDYYIPFIATAAPTSTTNCN